MVAAAMSHEPENPEQGEQRLIFRGVTYKDVDRQSDRAGHAHAVVARSALAAVPAPLDRSAGQSSGSPCAASQAWSAVFAVASACR